MSLWAYIFTMGLGTLASSTAWLVVVFLINPDETTALGFALFYLSLFLALTGFLSLAGLVVRVSLRRRDLIARKVINSFRQATLLALFLSVSLILGRRGLLTWGNSFFLIGGLAIFELTLLSLRSNKNRPGRDESVDEADRSGREASDAGC